jgi:hypothetical protein
MIVRNCISAMRSVTDDMLEKADRQARQNRASLPRRRLLLGREGQTAFQGISGAGALSIRAACCR